MDNKIAKNTYLSTLESKKQTKQTRRTETESWVENILMVARWKCGRMGEEVRGLRSTNRQLRNSHGGVKHGIGNGVAKELMTMDVNDSGGIA